MDQLQHRLEALEHQVHTLTQHTHRATLRLRWWRGLACALVGLGVLSWALPSGTAQGTLEPRVAALEAKLVKLTFETATNTVVITGANLQIVNGLGSTDCTDAAGAPIPNCPNGAGNLIVGYNEPRGVGFEDVRTGSHHVVVGEAHNFSRWGGLVVGYFNTISGNFAAVSGGSGNTASGSYAAVSGGQGNRAFASYTVVSGGYGNLAGNTEDRGNHAMVSGGLFNGATGPYAVVSGGKENEAYGYSSSLSGGYSKAVAGDYDWRAGRLFQGE